MKQFQKILYLAETYLAHESAIARAISLAENNQADLTVIDIVPVMTAGIGMPPGGPISTDLQTATVDKRRKELEDLVGPYKDRVDIQIDVMVGTVFLEAIYTVLRDEYDLLIKPAENPNFIERLFGSNDMHLLRKCPCPVWLTRSEEKPTYSCVLAAVDFDIDRVDMSDKNLNQQILEIASSFGATDFAELHFIHVWDAPGEMTVKTWSDNPDKDSRIYVEGERARHERAMNSFNQQVKNRLGKEAYDHISPQFHLVRGAPSRVIPETARQLQADLVVMGTVARTGISGLIIGNTAETVLQQLQCSVIAVKPDGFVSPVKLSEQGK